MSVLAQIYSPDVGMLMEWMWQAGVVRGAPHVACGPINLYSDYLFSIYTCNLLKQLISIKSTHCGFCELDRNSQR